MSEVSEKKSKSAIDMIKLGLVLSLYAAASCTVLAVVNNITSPVIVQNQIRKANEGMKHVFPLAKDFEAVTDYANSDATISIDKLYLAKDGKEVLGAVAQVTGPTYDHSTILVGVDADGKVTGVEYLENTDTPGFGQKASDPTFKLANGNTFYGQFAGKNVSDGFTAGETFDAISGATITSTSVARLITCGTAACTDAFKAAKESSYE